MIVPSKAAASRKHQQQEEQNRKRIHKIKEEDDGEEVVVNLSKKLKKPNTECIPYHMVGEMLLNLPVKSLYRFKSLSKHFNSLISSNRFVRDHLHYSRNNLSRRVFIFQKNNTTITMLDYDSIQRLEQESLEDGNRIIELSSKDFTFPSYSDVQLNELEFQITSCCDGIICIASLCETNVGLWNPYTNDYRRLPQISSYGERDSCFGVGYDSSIDDYKIVRFPAFVYAGGFPPKRPDLWTIYVMTLRSNVWREVYYYFPYIALLRQKPVLAADGSRLYWLAQLHSRKYIPKYVIIAFDLAEETATEILLPRGAPYFLDDFCLCLGLLQGHLSFACYDYRNNSFGVWMMLKEKQEAPEEETWIKSFSFPLSHYKGSGRILALTPHFITTDGALVMDAEIHYPDISESEVRYRELIYDPKQGTCKQFCVDGVSDQVLYYAVNITQSLVSPSSYT